MEIGVTSEPVPDVVGTRMRGRRWPLQDRHRRCRRGDRSILQDRRRASRYRAQNRRQSRAPIRCPWRGQFPRLSRSPRRRISDDILEHRQVTPGAPERLFGSPRQTGAPHALVRHERTRLAPNCSRSRRSFDEQPASNRMFRAGLKGERVHRKLRAVRATHRFGRFEIRQPVSRSSSTRHAVFSE